MLRQNHPRSTHGRSRTCHDAWMHPDAFPYDFDVDKDHYNIVTSPRQGKDTHLLHFRCSRRAMAFPFQKVENARPTAFPPTHGRIRNSFLDFDSSRVSPFPTVIFIFQFWPLEPSVLSIIPDHHLPAFLAQYYCLSISEGAHHRPQPRPYHPVRNHQPFGKRLPVDSTGA